ncbi:unnamed protein product [Ambrosiozyma monospora]|uniref:Unnamed protein product n=1 Tax=Ambrosiozyma monospora TaxID=43982 RepID=A0ACB5SVG2_AMBMO|nr:unnamed protein product [Ambrosiozyma monospora]
MNIEDDFFAFRGSSTAPNKHQKKPKKKKKSKKKSFAKKEHTDKSHTSSNSIILDFDSDGDSLGTTVKNKVSTKLEFKSLSRSNSIDDRSRKSLKKKQEEDRKLADLLGLTIDTNDDDILPAKRSASRLYGSMGDNNEEQDDEDDDIDDDFKVTRRRGTTRTSINSQNVSSQVSPRKQRMLQRDKQRAEMENKDEDVDDGFLQALNKDLESALKPHQRHPSYSILPSPRESEVTAMPPSQQSPSQIQTQPQLQSQRESESMLSSAKSKKSEQVIMLNGKRTKLKHVPFQLNTTIFIPNFTPSKMTLSVKGSVLFNKLITKILTSTMTQTDQDNPLYKAMIPKLVVYIHELNVIMSQYLKVGQLIGISDNGSDLELPRTTKC